jgi:hypothetical protein
MARCARSSNGQAQSVPGLHFGPGRLFHLAASHGGLSFVYPDFGQVRCNAMDGWSATLPLLFLRITGTNSGRYAVI